jgi:hypothetical protein
MSLSRRQFFRQFWNPEDKTHAQRIARYEALENDARRYMLPYDFSLTPEQESELFGDIRSVLEPVSNKELFAPAIIQLIERVVEARLQPWREANWLQQKTERAEEVRQAASGYVTTFLTMQATPQTVDQLKLRWQAADTYELETLLRQRIATWIAEVPDEELVRYDVVSIKDLVFAQLRSWC